MTAAVVLNSDIQLVLCDRETLVTLGLGTLGTLGPGPPGPCLKSV